MPSSPPYDRRQGVVVIRRLCVCKLLMLRAFCWCVVSVADVLWSLFSFISIKSVKSILQFQVLTTLVAVRDTALCVWNRRLQSERVKYNNQFLLLVAPVSGQFFVMYHRFSYFSSNMCLLVKTFHDIYTWRYWKNIILHSYVIITLLYSYVYYSLVIYLFSNLWPNISMM